MLACWQTGSTDRADAWAVEAAFHDVAVSVRLRIEVSRVHRRGRPLCRVFHGGAVGGFDRDRQR
jgi:hypothetical protein